MLSIIIPTYNEKDNVRPLIAQIADALDDVCDYELLFVDDSSDETPALLAELALASPKVRYIHRSDKTGLASAVVRGFGEARGDILAVMDADLQHPPRLLAPMVGLIEGGADVVLPSRYIDGGASEGLSPIRTLASKAARFASKVFLGAMRKMSDPMSGFFMIRKSVIEGVQFRPIGWKILMEVMVLGRYKSVVEIPYGFEKRHAGTSKLSMRVTVQYFLHILSLVARSERDRRFYLFALVGASGVLVDMLAFSALTSLWHLSNNAATSLSACLPIITNYLLNRNFTWKGARAEKFGGEFARYALVCALGLGFKNIVVYLLSAAALPGFMCNLAGIACATVSNYLLNNLWVFPQAPDDRISYTRLDHIEDNQSEDKGAL